MAANTLTKENKQGITCWFTKEYIINCPLLLSISILQNQYYDHILKSKIINNHHHNIRRA